MPKRISKRHKEAKTVEPTASGSGASAVDPLALDRAIISRIMSEMGRKGGKIGGKRRLETMTHEQRGQVALKAAQARWAKSGKRRTHS